MFSPMRTQIACLACTMALTASVVGQGPAPVLAPAAGLTLTASTASIAMPPGGVILVTALASQPVTAVEGYAFGRPVRFWPDTANTKWMALVAAGLDAKPGPQTVTMTAAGTSGKATTSLAIRVEPKRFETRRLKVDPQFVNPSPSETERALREQKQMAAIFAEVTPMRLWHGAFEMPVPGEATSSFGRLSVLNGESRGRHQGADFRAATGTPVHAPNGGRVALAADLYFSGNTVILDHGLGMFSLLAHLSKISVETGATVARGDVLGDSGATGRVTGPHLHWALRLGPASVDPIALVAAVAPIADER
jgi:murein DD-endopeptidase MepM/ murein hydrolase activator NlpD